MKNPTHRVIKENRMFFRQLVVPTAVLIFSVTLNGCSLFTKEVKLEDVPPAAQAVIESYTSGEGIEKITHEEEEGNNFYKVEYKNDGRKFELEVDKDGEVLEAEEIVTLEDLPPAAQETVKTESAGAEIKELALLETEEGKTFYEVEFEKDGKEHRIKIAEDGTILIL
jgi:uncharacterized membrane protein YkoI